MERVAPEEYIFFDRNIALGGLTKMVSSLVSLQAVRLSISKPTMKELLKIAGVPVPDGKSFDRRDFEDAYSFFSDFDKPTVVKPSIGKGGDGITTNVRSAEEFRRAWHKALKESSNSSSIMVEKHVTGLDVRAFVVGDRVVAAATRLPAFVQGDGRSTLDTLVEAEIEKRSGHAYLHRLPVFVDEDWLELQEVTMSSVPAEGTVVTLNGTVNLHQGGEQVNITETLSDDLKTMAVRAAHSMPGLVVAGIDLLVSSMDTVEGAVVLEANHSANINVHHLPAYGSSVDVGLAIVDEIISQSANGRLLYY